MANIFNTLTSITIFKMQRNFASKYVVYAYIISVREMIPMNGKFGDILKDLRIKNNLTQEQLASELNITRQTVSSWERGKSLPDIDMISRIASLFNISVNALFLKEINRVNNSLRIYKIIVWVFITLIFSVFSVYIYNSTHPTYKTDIKEYKHSCSSSGFDYKLYKANDGTGDVVYWITKEVEVEYEFGVYCVPVQFKFSDSTKFIEESSYNDIEVTVPYGFIVDNNHSSLSYGMYGEKQWRLYYDITLKVQNKTNKGVEEFVSNDRKRIKVDLQNYELLFGKNKFESDT